jgi:hypothetical protein
VAKATTQTAGPAAAPPDQPDGAHTPPAIEIEIGAGLWLPRLIGDTKITGAGARKLSLDNQLDLHDLEPTLNFDATFAVPDVACRISGFRFSTDGSDTFTPRSDLGSSQQFGGLTLNDGDTFDSHFDLWTAGVEVQILAVDVARGIASDDGPASVSIVPVLGARWIDVEQSVSVGAVEQDNHSQWIAAQAGGAFALRWQLPMDFPLARRVNINVTGQLGPVLGADPGFVWELRAALAITITENFTASVGYRLLNFDVEDEDFQLDAGLQGLFVAGSLRF